MAKCNWIPRSALSQQAGHAKSDGRGGVFLTEQPGGVSLHIAAFKGTALRVAEALSSALGYEVTLAARAAFAGDATVLWNGPGQWLVNFPDHADRQKIEQVRRSVGAQAAIVDQSDGRVFFEIRGDLVREVLSKLAGVDLHPKSFTVGSCALTPLGHVPGVIWREVDQAGAAVFGLGVPRSYAHDALDYLQNAGTEFSMSTKLADPHMATSST